PPTSALFPYTTLFRSLGRPADRALRLHARIGLRCNDAGLPHARLPPAPPRCQVGEGRGVGLGLGQRQQSKEETCPDSRSRASTRDRKSTRLNSSHVAI